MGIESVLDIAFGAFSVAGLSYLLDTNPLLSAISITLGAIIVVSIKYFMGV